MFVDTFIRRPILASVCSLVIILAGAISIPSLPIAQFPDLAPPQVQVVAVYIGASAETVETTVTTPLEQAINGIEGMQYMTSSSADGAASLIITFDITRNLDIAAVDVQNRIAQVTGRLPAEVTAVGITVAKVSQNFVLAASAFAEHNEYDLAFVSNYIDRFVKDDLRRVEGVGDIVSFGERRYAMRIWLDPERMAAQRVTAEDVVNALREQNVQIAAGQVGAPPTRKGQTYQLTVRGEGRLSEPAQFEEIILRNAGAGGGIVRIRDVGRAELGAQDYSQTARYNGRDAVGFGVLQLPTANSLQVYTDIDNRLKELSKRFPPGLKVEIAFDTTTIVSESIREVVVTLLEAIGLVIIVMFLFLQNWRTTLIPAITIPVSLIGTLAFVKLFGFSVNTLTLFGITLATGLVVDDAIVVIENIERHVHEFHKKAVDAASEAMSEVTGAVIATALVLAAVFVPIAFFPGTTGRLYQQFALTIAFSMAISAFNALTLTPALAGVLLERQERTPGVFFTFVNRVIDGGTAWMVRGLRVLVRWRWAVTAVFVGLLVLTYQVYSRVPSSFVPDADQGYVMVIIQGPPGASLDYTMNIAQQAEQIVMAQPEASNMFAVGGFGFAGSSPNSGLMFIMLKDFKDRIGPEHSAPAVVGRLFGAFSQIPGAVVIPILPPAINGLSVFGGFTYELLDQSGGSLQDLQNAAMQLVGQANQTPGLAQVFTQFTANDPQLVLKINREQTKSLGLSLRDITSTMQLLLGSAYVNDFDLNNRSYRVYVQADQQFRESPSDINRFQVRGADGRMLPMNNLVSVSEATSAKVISHYNLFRSVEITGSTAPGFSSGQAIGAMENLSNRLLPQGMTYSWSGLSLEEIRAGRQSLFIFALGLLLVYLTLAAQYESVTLPFIILLSVPLAILGAMLAQMSRGLTNDVYCQIGLVMLIGLSAKNGILIVEFAEQLRHKGMSVVDAAIEAARIRLRPILMTSLAFILGTLPLVFATGAGNEARHSVGTVVAGGMVASTFLNLAFIPVLYVMIKSVGRARE